MILLDSCAVLEILWGGAEARELSEYLDAEELQGVEIVFLNLALLESCSAVAIRHKERQGPRSGAFEADLATVAGFQTQPIADDLTPEIIMEAARIKLHHAASMVDCYLIANALHRKAAIISSDSEVLEYNAQRATVRRITSRFSSIHWR